MVHDLAAFKLYGDDDLECSDQVSADTRAIVDRLFAERERLGIRVRFTRSVYGWRSGREPAFGSIVAMATSFGFELVMVKDAEELVMTDAQTVMARLFEERKRIGMSFWDMEVSSGISIKSAYSWKKGDRKPSLGNLIALANTLGFECVMRRALH